MTSQLKRYSTINPIGKVGKFNQKVNKEIHKLCVKLDIPYEYCEYCIRIGSPTDGTSPHMFVASAHRHKRDWYKEGKWERMHLLYDYHHFIRMCQWHHNLIEYNKELAQKVFEILRRN